MHNGFNTNYYSLSYSFIANQSSLTDAMFGSIAVEEIDLQGKFLPD